MEYSKKEIKELIKNGGESWGNLQAQTVFLQAIAKMLFNQLYK